MTPSIYITSLSGTFPGRATVWAIHEDRDEAYVFQVETIKDGGLAGPWMATAEGAGKVGEGSSHLGFPEALARAMQDALAGC